MRSSGIGPGFGDVDSASGSAAEFIQYLDAARAIAQIAQAKLWSFDRLRLAPGHSALDVGCGTGEDVVAMAGLVAPDGRATGVDASQAMVSEATRRHANVAGVSFLPADAHELPFEPHTFNACRAERTLQHVDDPDQVIREMARVLKPGGWVALIEPDWEGLLIEGSDPHMSRAIWGARIEGFRQPRVGRRLRSLLTWNGFVDITLEATVGILTQFAIAERNFEFSKAASEAAEAGVISGREATRWLDELQKADSDGVFLCTAVSFRAAAHRPDE